MLLNILSKKGSLYLSDFGMGSCLGILSSQPPYSILVWDFAMKWNLTTTKNLSKHLYLNKMCGRVVMLGFFCMIATACSNASETETVPTKYSNISAYNPQDYQQAYAYFRSRGAQGDANAMDNLGHMFADGRGVQQDPQEALNWYQRAANAGDADAALNMGVACLYGQGTQKDVKQACQWFKRAETPQNAFAGQFYKEYC